MVEAVEAEVEEMEAAEGVVSMDVEEEAVKLVETQGEEEAEDMTEGNMVLTKLIYHVSPMTSTTITSHSLTSVGTTSSLMNKELQSQLWEPLGIKTETWITSKETTMMQEHIEMLESHLPFKLD